MSPNNVCVYEQKEQIRDKYMYTELIWLYTGVTQIYLIEIVNFAFWAFFNCSSILMVQEC